MPTRETGNTLLSVLLILFILVMLSAAQVMILQKNMQQSSYYSNRSMFRAYAEAGINLSLHDLEFSLSGNEGQIGTVLWTSADDLGRDGIAGTYDDGELDGVATPGEPHLSPASIGPADMGISLIVQVLDTPWADVKEIVSTAFNSDAMVAVGVYTKRDVIAFPAGGAVYMDPIVGLNLSGGSNISGSDTNLDGTAGSNPDSLGIMTSVGDPPGTNSDLLSSQVDVGKYDDITGSGGSPSIGESEDIDVYALFDDLKEMSTVEYLDGVFTNVYCGTSATPEITYVKGDLSLNASATGNGILLVDGGSFKMSGSAQFTGLVIVLATLDVDLTGGGGTEDSPNISGMLLIAPNGEATPELKMSGGSWISCSSEAMETGEQLMLSQGSTFLVLGWDHH